MSEIDGFLDDLDRLAQTATPADPQAFYRQLLPAAAAALGADAAEFVPFNRLEVDASAYRWAVQGTASALLDAVRLERLRAEGTPRVIADAAGAPVVACPVDGTEGVAGALVLRLGGSSPSAERSLGVAGAMAEAAGRFEQRFEAARVATSQRRLERVESLLVRLHGCRTWRDAAQEAADAGRGLVGCDRLAVLSPRGGAWRVEAASGVRSVSRRSDAARRMTRLTELAAKSDETLRRPGLEGQRADPVIDVAVDSYCDAAGVRSLRVVPCRVEGEAGKPRAFLLAEWFDGAVAEDADASLAALARHVAVAAERCGTLAPGARSFGARGALFGGVIASALVVYALLTPATLWLHVEGRFEPVDRARVFAPLDGVVAEVFVKQADVVSAGQKLARLESTELRLKREEIDESIAATEAELSAIETEKLRTSLPGRDEEADDATTLASRSAALRERLDYRRKQQTLVAEQESKLVVTSPLAGAVVSWRPEDYLAQRPVRRGQRLLEIAGDGRWRLELDAPDHRSGPLLRAWAEGGAKRVEFVVRSSPEATHHGLVESVAGTTLPDAQGAPVIRVVALPDDASAAKPRSGLGVAAKIDCGKHPLAYVWLHEAIDAVRRRWF